MNTRRLFEGPRRGAAWLVLSFCLVILVGAALTASLVQRDFGQVAVSNVTYANFNGIEVRAKLFEPIDAAPDNRLPGVVYIHGYQNNRETGDAYCLELGRRGFVVLNIDAIGRGNSGMPNDPAAADFDLTYGGQSSLEYLRALPTVDADSVGVMGHSLGAEMAYHIALQDEGVAALVLTGFAYTSEASATKPRNMLMIFGKWDEFRGRMTGTQDFEAEWMGTAQTRQVIGSPDPRFDPQFDVTYGSFADGSARRVHMPRSIHIQESHHKGAIAETLEWMRAALHPPERYWVDAQSQIWPLKEWATLIALLSAMATLLPLGLILLRTKFFASLQGTTAQEYACSGRPYFKYAAVNALLMCLYWPLIFSLFGLHVYVVHIDGAFPMMMVNGIVWWFVWSNVIGFFLLRRWRRKQGLSWASLGASFQPDRFAVDWSQLGKTALLAAILFACVYVTEHTLEALFIIDYRFIFPFASDLTPARALIMAVYFPLLLVGFGLMGLFLHGQLRRPRSPGWRSTFGAWSAANLAVVILPLLLLLAIQYVPLLTTGSIPLVGPGGMLVTFTINLFHIIGVLLLAVPLSTWFYQLTGKIYLGALVNAALVAWMFASSQVVAPIPI